jgi:hypothetical protein
MPDQAVRAPTVVQYYTGRELRGHRLLPHLSVTRPNSAQMPQVPLSLFDFLRELDTGNHDTRIVERLEPVGSWLLNIAS